MLKTESEDQPPIVPTTGEAMAEAALAPVSEMAGAGRASPVLPMIIGAALFMQTLDSTVIANALPTMARSLRESPVTLNLAITAYLLSAAIFLPISAWVADRFGAKHVFRASIIGFALSSLLCGLAQNLPEMVAARMLQGLAGAMMLPVGRLVLLRSVPKSQLVSAMSYLTVPALLGPILGPDLSTSILLVQRLMNGALPGLPHLVFGVVDVRDVADLHIRAMTHPAASGERFLAVGGDFKTIHQIALILKEGLGRAAARVPTRQLPNWLVRLAALWDPAIRVVAPELGKMKNAGHDKAARLLGWSPRPDAEAIVASAESLRELGLLKG